MRKPLLLLILAFSAVAFFVSYNSEQAQPKAIQFYNLTPSPSPQTPNIAKLVLPAVDAEGVGQVAELSVEVKNGTGKIFIGLSDSPVINADTQTSLRTAFEVAKIAAGVTARDLDVYYYIATTSDAVGGKSAGAAAAVATLAALHGTTLRPEIVITGALEADGSISAVGRIKEKAEALKKMGYRAFLVPEGESREPSQCNENGCVEGQDIGREVGIRITEVKDVRAAYELMRAQR